MAISNTKISQKNKCNQTKLFCPRFKWNQFCNTILIFVQLKCITQGTSTSSSWQKVNTRNAACCCCCDAYCFTARDVTLVVMNNEEILLTAYSCSLPNGRMYTEHQTCESPRFAVALWRCHVTDCSDLSETFFVQRIVTSATMS